MLTCADITFCYVLTEWTCIFVARCSRIRWQGPLLTIDHLDTAIFRRAQNESLLQDDAKVRTTNVKRGALYRSDLYVVKTKLQYRSIEFYKWC